jgi:long-chain fatty acid transport protein
LAGSERSHTNVLAFPTLGLAYLPDDSRWSFGMGGGISSTGIATNYPGSAFNPVASPPFPHDIGLGPLYSQFLVYRFTLAAAYKLTDHFSVGAGPCVDLAQLTIDPAIFARPDNAGGNALPTYPPGTYERTVVGGGFLAGVFYHRDTWGLGASVKSPQWFDTFHFASHDALGRTRSFGVGFDLPTIYSVGASYTGFPRWLLAVDGRYIDYANARGFSDQGFAPDGAVRGLGWRGVFAAAVGVQYQLTESLSLRAGYTWNGNPVRSSQAMVNALSPAISEHAVAAGASWNVTDVFTISVAYSHNFANSVEGPLVTPAGPVRGSSVRSTASGDSMLLSFSVKFGAPNRPAGVHSEPLPPVPVVAKSLDIVQTSVNNSPASGSPAAPARP